MLEKNGLVTLTTEELELYNKGLVSQRLRDTWNLNLEALREIVESNNYNLVSSHEQS